MYAHEAGVLVERDLVYTIFVYRMDTHLRVDIFAVFRILLCLMMPLSEDSATRTRLVEPGKRACYCNFRFQNPWRQHAIDPPPKD